MWRAVIARKHFSEESGDWFEAIFALKSSEHMKTRITSHFGVLCSRLAIKQIGIWVWPGSPSTRKDPSPCVLTVGTGPSAGGREAALLRAPALLSTSNFRKPRRKSECSWTMRKALCLFTTRRPRPTFTLTPDVASLNPCIHTSTPVSMTTARTRPLWSSVPLRLWCHQFEKPLFLSLSMYIFYFQALTIVITYCSPTFQRQWREGAGLSPVTHICL